MSYRENRLNNARSLADRLGSAAAFAKKLDKSESQVNQFMGLNPTRGIGDKIARQIERAFGKPKGWLDTDHSANIKEIESDFVQVPIISYVQAGTFSEAIDMHPVGLSDDYQAISSRLHKNESVYALRVSGDSMTPLFPDGCIIIVNPLDISPDHNDYVIAKENGHDAVTFKQFKAGTPPRIQGLHPDYKDIKEEFRILGKVIGSYIETVF